MPDENGEAQDVYIYQGDRYLDKVEKVETFNRVMVEQTDEDKARFARQMQKIELFKAYLNKNAITRLGIAPRSKVPEPEVEEVIQPPTPPVNDDDFMDDYMPTMSAKERATQTF